MGLTDLRQLLPQDVVNALFNANAPSAANPFATMADVVAGAVNIYNTSDSITSDRVVTLNSNTLRFDMSNVGVGGDCFVIGAAAPFFAVNSWPIQFQNNTVIGASVGIGGSGGAGSPYMTLTASAAISSWLANGEVVLRSGVGSDLRLQVNNTATDIITITSAGLVGISDNSPSAKLDILQNTVGTGAKGISVNFNTIGEVFYIDDNGISRFNSNAGLYVRGSNGMLTLRSNGGTNPNVVFQYADGASTSGQVYGVGAGMFIESPSLGVSGANFTAGASLHVKGAGSTSATLGFIAENSVAVATAWFRFYNDGTLWSQSNTDIAHLITTYGNSLEVRFNGVTTSTFSMQVNGSTVSSYINQTNLSRFNQAAGQSWGIYGSDNNPYLLFTESNKLITAYKSFSMPNNTPVTGIADSFEMYATDIVAGNSAPHFRTENGDVIKLFKSSAYTVTNLTTDRSYNANVTNVLELADVLGTLITDLQATGIIG